jgi:S1-C subfamily serine protease
MDDEQDLALLKTETEKPLMPLDLSPSVPQLGENVVALIIELNALIKIQIGTVTARVVGSTITGGDDKRIEILLPVTPGASGTPVFDKERRFLGLVVSTNPKSGNTALIPAELVISFFEGFLRNSGMSNSLDSESGE